MEQDYYEWSAQGYLCPSEQFYWYETSACEGYTTNIHIPIPPVGMRSSTSATTTSAIPDEEQKETKDEDMLERTNMGRSRKYRKILLHMAP